MRTSRNLSNRLLSGRRGLAPLDLVMVLPLICLLLYALMSITKTSLASVSVMSKGRDSVWQRRQQVTSSDQLSPASDAEDGIARGTGSGRMVIEGPWFGGIFNGIRAYHASGDEWNVDRLRFASSTGAYDWHHEILELAMGGGSVGGVGATALRGVVVAFYIPGYPHIVVKSGVNWTYQLFVRTWGTINLPLMDAGATVLIWLFEPPIPFLKPIRIPIPFARVDTGDVVSTLKFSRTSIDKIYKGWRGDRVDQVYTNPNGVRIFLWYPAPSPQAFKKCWNSAVP